MYPLFSCLVCLCLCRQIKCICDVLFALLPQLSWMVSFTLHPHKLCLFMFNLMIKSWRGGWQSAHSSLFMLIMLAMSKFLSPPPRLLPLLEDLPVHAVGIHFRHIVSIFCCQLIAQISQGVFVVSSLWQHINKQTSLWSCVCPCLVTYCICLYIVMSTVTFKARVADVCVWPSNRHCCWRVTSWWVHMGRKWQTGDPWYGWGRIQDFITFYLKQTKYF